MNKSDSSLGNKLLAREAAGNTRARPRHTGHLQAPPVTPPGGSPTRAFKPGGAPQVSCGVLRALSPAHLAERKGLARGASPSSRDRPPARAQADLIGAGAISTAARSSGTCHNVFFSVV